MRWAFRVGSIAGIAIRIHFTFVFLLVLLFSVGGLAGGWRSGLRSVLLIVLVFVCVLLHELGHSYISTRFGYRVRSITLLPIGGLALLDEMPHDPWKEIWISLAGPAVNFFLAIWLGGLLFFYQPDRFFHPGISVDWLLASIFWANLYLGLFNLLPAYPLDGGRILRAWLVRRMVYVEATRHAVSVGQLLSVGFMLYGLVMQLPWLVVVGLFVFWAGLAEERLAVLQSAMENIYLEEVMLTEFQALAPSDSLFDAVERAMHSLQDDFPVVSDGRVVGVLTRNALLRAFGGARWKDSVQAVMSTRFESARPRENLAAAFRWLTNRKVSMVPVVDGERLVGIVTLQNLLHSIKLLSRKGAAEIKYLRRD